jgi:hypothetical protein
METCLHEKRKAKAVEKSGGSCSTRLAGHVARLAGRYLVSYRLGQVGGAPHGPTNTTLRWKLEHTQHYLEIPLAKLSFLV